MSSNENDEEKRASLLRRKDRIIKEFFDSERTYQHHLSLIQKYFINPLKDASIIESYKQVTLFSNLQSLIEVNKELLEHFEKDGIVYAFLRMGQFLKLYSTYANNHEHALETLMELDQKNSQFATWRRAQEEKPQINGLKLNALLITPVQRIPRYKLLLEDLLSVTSAESEDHEKLQECVRQVGEVAMHINDHIKQQDNYMRMYAIQKALTGSAAPNIIVPGRIFIKEGILYKVSKKSGWSQERMFFLFSDMLMYAKIYDTTSNHKNYYCCCIMPLHHCKVDRLFGKSHGQGALFNITCKEECLLLYSDNQTVDGWLSALNKAINSVQVSRQTLKKPSSAKSPLRKPGLRRMKQQQETDPMLPWLQKTDSFQSPKQNKLKSSPKLGCLSPKNSDQKNRNTLTKSENQFGKNEHNASKIITSPITNHSLKRIESVEYFNSQKLSMKSLLCMSPQRKKPKLKIPCSPIITLPLKTSTNEYFTTSANDDSHNVHMNQLRQSTNIKEEESDNNLHEGTDADDKTPVDLLMQDCAKEISELNEAPDSKTNFLSRNSNVSHYRSSNDIMINNINSNSFNTSHRVSTSSLKSARFVEDDTQNRNNCDQQNINSSNESDLYRHLYNSVNCEFEPNFLDKRSPIFHSSSTLNSESSENCADSDLSAFNSYEQSDDEESGFDDEQDECDDDDFDESFDSTCNSSFSYQNYSISSSSSENIFPSKDAHHLKNYPSCYNSYPLHNSEIWSCDQIKRECSTSQHDSVDSSCFEGSYTPWLTNEFMNEYFLQQMRPLSTIHEDDDVPDSEFSYSEEHPTCSEGSAENSSLSPKKNKMISSAIRYTGEYILSPTNGNSAMPNIMTPQSCSLQ